VSAESDFVALYAALAEIPTRTKAQIRFEHAVEGMVQALQEASDPTTPEFIPYKGWPRLNVEWWVREVARQARGLGLLPLDPPLCEHCQQPRARAFGSTYWACGCRDERVEFERELARKLG